MSKTTYVTDCPRCGEPAEVDMSLMYTTYPAQYDAYCDYNSCENIFRVFETEIRKKETISGRQVGKTLELYQQIGEVVFTMKSNEVLVNYDNNLVMKQELPDKISVLIEKSKVLDEILDLYINSKDEYVESKRHLLDLFLDDIHNILKTYVGDDE